MWNSKKLRTNGLNGINRKVVLVKNNSYITAKNSKIAISEYLIKKDQHITTNYAPDRLRAIIILSDSSITKSAIKLLGGCDVLFIDNNEPIGSIVSQKHIPHKMIIEKKLAALNNAKKIKLAFVFCKGACMNKITHAKRLNEYRNNKEIQQHIDSMRKLQKGLINCNDFSCMRAIEANVAKHYFSIFRLLLPKNAGFVRREKTDADIMNVLMNATHSVLRGRITRLLVYNGINSGYGFLHYQKDKQKQFMAWDFAEFWLPYVDKLCFFAVNKGIFKEKDMKNALHGQNTKWLSDDAWKKLYVFFDKRITDESIQRKIDDFRNYILERGHFSWKV